jgi:hypothetical protein
MKGTSHSFHPTPLTATVQLINQGFWHSPPPPTLAVPVILVVLPTLLGDVFEVRLDSHCGAIWALYRGPHQNNLRLFQPDNWGSPHVYLEQPTGLEAHRVGHVLPRPCHPDVRQLLVRTKDGTILWDAAQRAKIGDFPDTMLRAAFCGQDGNTVLYGTTQSKVGVMRLSDRGTRGSPVSIQAAMDEISVAAPGATTDWSLCHPNGEWGYFIRHGRHKERPRAQFELPRGRRQGQVYLLRTDVSEPVENWALALDGCVHAKRGPSTIFVGIGRAHRAYPNRITTTALELDMMDPTTLWKGVTVYAEIACIWTAQTFQVFGLQPETREVTYLGSLPPFDPPFAIQWVGIGFNNKHILAIVTSRRRKNRAELKRQDEECQGR